MITAGIGSSMDSVDEDIIQALDINEDDIDDNEGDYDDDDDVIIIPLEPIAPDLDLNVDNQGLPEETNEYFHTLEYQTRQLEQELDECDELLKYDVHDDKPRPSQSLVPYDDLRELEELAAEQGMTVEELKEQLLKQLDDDDFDEDEVDTGYEEIHQLQRELADARSEVEHVVQGIDQEMKEFLENRENKDNEKPLAIEEGEKSIDMDKDANKTDEDGTMLANENSTAKTVSNEAEAGPLILPSGLTDMRLYIQQQLKHTDENLEEREKKLKQTFESQRHAEERMMLSEELKRKEFMQKFQEEEALLEERKKSAERKMEEELKSREGEIEEDYQNHQAYIEKLIEDYEGEKHIYETTRHGIQEREADRKRKAAIEIQRRYKGYRTRKKISSLISELAERREARQKEKYQLRLMEVQYEIDFKAEQDEKDKEEKKKKEEEDQIKKAEEEKEKELLRQKQEEAEQTAQMERMEEEMRKKEELEAEKQRQNELEEEKKLEEKRRKEEEKLRKEEERKRKEEEKKLKQEEEKKRKQEEKQRKEEDKRKKEEEKKQRMIEEKKQKDQEKRKEEEKKQREIEEKKDKKIFDDTKNADVAVNGISGEDKNFNNSCTTLKPDISIHNLKENVGGEGKDNSISTTESGTDIVFDNQDSGIKNFPVSEIEVMEEDGKLASSNQRQSQASSHNPQMTTDMKDPDCSAVTSSLCTGNASNNSNTFSSSAAIKSSLDPKTFGSSTMDKVNSTDKSEPSAANEPICNTEAALMSRSAVAPFVDEIVKPDPIEQFRLEWIKHCLPWSKVSNEPWKLNHMSAGKVVKRPSSAKKLPPLSESVVLAAAQAESLRQVSSVKLTDLPGCSLSTLSQCWSLRYLTISDCNLVCLDGLSACKHLMYINAENNKIEYIDLKDLGALQCVQLSGNCLTGTTGLDGCINLRWLDMSHSKIRRISGFSSLRRLHTLNLSHNQLTSSDGVEQAVTLQDVDLSHNFLQSLEKIDKLCLLTRLNLAANNILQPPNLKNQVLLQWLDLTENSLQSLAKFTRYWLPLLNDLKCGKNRLSALDGLETAVNLVSLDISDNQIGELESLKSGLTCCENLQCLKVFGNPLVDVYMDEFRDIAMQTVPGLSVIDDEPVSSKEQISKSSPDNEFLKMCLKQVKLHQKLRQQFESQRSALLACDEDLCSVIFSYCDTSFKMASEHRSAHEFGDVGLTESISQFKSPASFSSESSIASSQKEGHMIGLANESEVKRLKDRFDSSVHTSPIQQTAKVGAVNEGKFMNENFKLGKSYSGGALQTDHPSHQGRHVPSVLTNSNYAGKSSLKKQNDTDSQNIRAVDSDSDEEDGKNYVDVTKDFEIPESEKKMIYSRVPHPPPSGPSYLNEKDKFLLALEGGPGDSSKGRRSSPRSSRLSTSKPNGEYPNASALNAMNDASLYSSSIDRHNSPNSKEDEQISAKEKFNKLFSIDDSGTKSYGTSSQKNRFDEVLKEAEGPGSNGNPKLMPGVKADVVGNHLAAFEKERGLDTSMDSDVDLENMDFDFDKYLDMGELDEFLEKGWRPADAPQIPQSNYPVLGRIHDSNSANISRNKSQKAPIIPPPNPQQAWRDSPVSEMRHPAQTPEKSLFPNPSPSPSSVASAAETLGGGSIKSKKDEIVEEWGFKDSRTAEMMMARAKKMKYNAEKRRKLSKLDPHQRYQLFRKLEESGKIQHVSVKPPPARILPRKEYFQAKEDEANQQQFERRMEDKNRAHRTFEWLHTQVGDHPISTSRINPMPGPVYSNNDQAFNQLSDLSHNTNRKTKSPGSDHHLDSASVMGDNLQRQVRRYSVDEAFSTQSPMLPPIQINSAPSQHRNDRMSWRDSPVEKSGGWGGGKKRGGK